MLNFGRILKLFRKDDDILAVLRADMNEKELAEAIPHLSERLTRFIHDHAIGFYRAIGSHDFGAYPGVWEEFFFLVLFSIERKLTSILPAGHVDNAVASLRDSLNGFLVKHDAKFEPQPFWERYGQRAELYKRRLQPGEGRPCFDDIISAFSSNMVTRIDDWPKLVSHHSSLAAAAALTELWGEDS
jgi:hypothetical protein